MAKPATGDKAKPSAGHVDPAGVNVADRRNSASGCYINATDRRCRASDYGVTSENHRKCATEYGVAAGDRRGGGASGYRQRTILLPGLTYDNYTQVGYRRSL
ncbi:hypothetical protein DPMN_032391 [Dreissena polymorpha]|uniref:Uncharacterized protein n=1 Tax=Dreissena polymorpha TaxID=45954 RepID=A0A9D4M4L6_DREPO|nr:hypothetical protein DPMN_032391 [Dreissena polymorpha]